MQYAEPTIFSRCHSCREGRHRAKRAGRIPEAAAGVFGLLQGRQRDFLFRTNSGSTGQNRLDKETVTS